jgi:thiol-disulfide isomerase/thioredoxin
MGLCLGVVAILALVVLISVPTGADAASASGKLGQPAASLNGLQWVKGGPVEIKKGSVYVVEFWATWCPPCRTSIPHLTEMQHAFKDQGVTIIGISNEKADVVKPFVKEEKAGPMNYTVAIDPDRKVSEGYMGAFNVRGIPHAFIVGTDGKLVWHGHPMDQMDAVLKDVVAGDFDSVAYAKKKAAQEEKRERLIKLYKDYFAKVADDGDAASKAGREFVKNADFSMLNSFAWKILTNVAEEARDLDMAQKAAAKAVKLTEEKNPSILDTYALATYELGKKYVAQAVKSQKKAVELAQDNDQMREGLQKSLERYEAASVD